jgi:Ca2+-binding EF-hand superfamily protein
MPLNSILHAGTSRLALPLPERSELPELPPLENRSEFLLRDPVQMRDALWSEFQTGVRYRLEHRNDPPPPLPPPPPPHQSSRGPKIKRKEEPQLPPEPQDWTGKVALALHQIMKKSQARVQDVFKKFDTDGSNALDASEFHSALIELGIPQSLAMPEDNTGVLLQEVFDTMDDDSNGVLSFKEINKYLRAGKHEIVLDEKLQAGAVAVQSDFQQTHRTRRKEEWKALDRFDALDVGASGMATLRELTAFFLSEGYTQDFINQLMGVLDKNGDGSLTADEWRAGVTALRGSSLLMSMTDPVDPPSGENFKDIGAPRELARFGGYSRSLKGTTLHRDPDVKTGKTQRGCTIDAPEERAIKLSQLRAVVDHIQRRCQAERWVDTEGEPLELKKVSMYDTAAYVIKPATKKRQCSLVEAIARGPQPPRWFVSHWWGQPTVELKHCLEQHALDRSLDINSTAYWLSAFAISQWSLESTLSQTLSQSVFLRAMNLCDGCVSVVPSKGTEYHARIWCVFEAGAALERSAGLCPEVPATRGFLYDMYAPLYHRVQGELIDKGETPEGEIPICNFYPGRMKLPPPPPDKPAPKPPPEAVEQRHAVGRTEGLAQTDRDERCKAVRESHFPLAPLEAALSCKLQLGQASVERDRVQILNGLAGKDDLDGRPETSHRAYSELNGIIKGFVAKTSLVRAVIEDADGNPQMLNTLLEGLEESTVTKLDLSFAEVAARGFDVPYRTFERILGSLPGCMEELSVQLPHTVTKLPSGKLKTLPKLNTLRLSHSASLQSLPEDLIECYALTELDLAGLTSLAELPKKIFDLRSLQTLNVSSCHMLKTVASSGIAKSCLETLLLEDCIGLLELPDSMGSKLANLKLLSLRGCTNLTRMPMWVPELEKRDAAVVRPHHLE